MLRHVVLVEDDHLQEGPLADYLQDSVPDLTIETVTTESEFRNKLPDFRKQPPDLVIMDMMLRWAVPRLSMPDPPPEVLDGGYYRAGLRCIDLLRQDELLKDIPIILYTFLERQDLTRDNPRAMEGIQYLRKSADGEELARLVENGLRRGTS